jgi:hypothetical protein
MRTTLPEAGVTLGSATSPERAKASPLAFMDAVERKAGERVVPSSVERAICVDV